MLEQGLQLSVIGISMVFFFIIVLIIVMKITTYVITALNKVFPEQQEQATSVMPTVGPKNHDDIAAIIAAVTAFRKK